MRCIKCGHLKDKVVDSRSSKDGTSIRRRRVCLKCAYRFTTYENVERTEMMVRKKGGQTEALQRDKLLQGMVKACEKRPVSIAKLDRSVEEILNAVQDSHDTEVPAQMLGLEVMNKLHMIDPVAYIRYVSVYRQFDNVKEFIAEIQALESRSHRDHLHNMLSNQHQSSRPR